MQFTTPHSNTLALAIQGKDVVIPSIILLNCICSPKAVVRGIVTAIVTTLNTVFGGSLTASGTIVLKWTKAA